MKKRNAQQVQAGPLLQKALKQHQAGNLREAEALYRKALQADPASFDALHFLGVLMSQLGNPAQAAELIGRALQQNPQHAFAHNNLGLALQGLGRLDDAAASYREAIKYKEDLVDAYFNLGNVLQAQGGLEPAIEQYRKALALQPGDAEVHNNLGSALRGLGRTDEAIACYRQAVALRPAYAEAWSNLGVALQEQDQLDEAVASLQKALALAPGYVEAINNLGVAFWRRGELEKAIVAFDRAIALKPDYAEAHSNLGNVFQKQGLLGEAIRSYRKAIALMPTHARAHIYLGGALRTQGDLDEAGEHLRRAIELAPDDADAHVGMAELYIDLGSFDEARQVLDQALQLAPEHHKAWALQTAMRKMTQDDAGWLETAQRLVANPAIPWGEAVPLYFAIGKYYDDTKQYDLAFAAYAKANALKHEVERKFDRAGFSRLIDELIETYDAEFMRNDAEGASTSELPVLIVGMLRSGTSLTEQIIASHPQAFGAGELSYWGEQVDLNLDAVRSGKFQQQQLMQLAEQYERRLRRDAEAVVLRIVDKMPGNFLWLGLVHAVFPQAKIIHTRRNPIDTCLSIYFQDLLATHSYGTDLDDLAYYYREYARLMRHWRAVLPKDRYLEVPYDDLVEDQEAWSRRIIDFIGLPWDERVLDFHQTERKVGTWSNWQVRQKIYKSSKARWMNYEKHLGPLLALMEPE